MSLKMHIKKLWPWGYFLRHVIRSFSCRLSSAVYPVLKIGDLEVCFNPRDTAFVQYIYGLDFTRMRNICSKISSFLGKLAPDLLIDAGASYGIFTVLIRSFYIENIPTFCIEPDSRVFPFLEKNLKGLNKTDCVVIRGMVGECEQKGVFRENRYGSLDSRGAEVGDLEEYEETVVPSFSIDSLVYEKYHSSKKDRVLIKIDVQGLDIEALRGASKLLSNANTAVIILEVTPDVIPAWDPKKFFELTRKLGITKIKNLGESNIDWNEADLCDIQDYENFAILCGRISKEPWGYTNLALLKGL